MQETGRAIIRVEYRGSDKTYPGILLVRERNGKYSLPGGQRDASDKDLVATMIREVREELHLEIRNTFLQKPRHVLNWASSKYTHSIYEVIAQGTLAIDQSELTGIAFLNVGRKNQIPEHLLSGHVLALIKSGLILVKQHPKISPIIIPKEYFRSKVQDIISWEEQKSQF